MGPPVSGGRRGQRRSADWGRPGDGAGAAGEGEGGRRGVRGALGGDEARRVPGSRTLHVRAAVSRHRHAIPAALFSFVVPHTIATARGLLREAASSASPVATSRRYRSTRASSGSCATSPGWHPGRPRRSPPSTSTRTFPPGAPSSAASSPPHAGCRTSPAPSSPTWSPGATGHRPRWPREPSGYSSTASPGKRNRTASSIPPGSWGCSSNRTGPMSRTVHPLRGARTHRLRTGTAPQHQRQDPEAGAAGTVRRGGA